MAPKWVANGLTFRPHFAHDFHVANKGLIQTVGVAPTLFILGWAGLHEGDTSVHFDRMVRNVSPFQNRVPSREVRFSESKQIQSKVGGTPF